jgi:predicted ATPase
MAHLTRTSGHPFGGRGEVLDLLEGWRRDAADGQTRLVLITGEPGLGKTRLVYQWLGDHARRQVKSWSFNVYGSVVL